MTKDYAKQLSHLDEESAIILLRNIRREDIAFGYEKGYYARVCDVAKANTCVDRQIKREFDAINDQMRQDISDRYKLA